MFIIPVYHVTAMFPCLAEVEHYWLFLRNLEVGSFKFQMTVIMITSSEVLMTPLVFQTKLCYFARQGRQANFSVIFGFCCMKLLPMAAIFSDSVLMKPVEVSVAVTSASLEENY